MQHPLPAGRGRRLPLLLSGLLLAGLWLALDWSWLQHDRLPRDGDEEGHVGAAELVAAEWWAGRPAGAVEMALAGRLGDYPPLYPGLVGSWWALWGGEPGRPLVRGINLLWPLIAAGAVAALLAPLGAGPLLAGLAAVLLLPLPSGISRHFMPEGAVMAAVALLAALLARAPRRPLLRALPLGLLLGLGLLLKQTFALYAAPLLLGALLRARGPGRLGLLLAGMLGLAVFLPWFLPGLGEQLAYGSGSLRGAGQGVPAWRHLAFYPWSLLWLGAGPPLALAGLSGLLLGLRAGGRRAELARCGLWWLAGLALLLLVPRKYPRLLLPLLPAIGLGLGLLAGGSRRAQGLALAALFLGAAWWGWGSFRGLPLPRGAEVLDERCPQRWFRPPVDDDLGLSAVVEAARRLPPGPVAVLDPPEIPCELQTTFRWDAHLGPALRRAGVDREVGEWPLPGAVLLVNWSGRPVGRPLAEVRVPSLGRSFWLERP